MSLLDRVRHTIRAYGLAEPATRVVAALSGGSDSVALVCLLAELDAAGDLRLAGAAHFNHRLRAAADADERFSESLAARLGVPYLAASEDVAALARSQRRSVEGAARAARYAFFERARQHFDADAIALGHTRDDQAETFLLRLLRGAGPRGLGAMHPNNGAIIRPLLDCRRAELREYLAAREMSFVHDESNEDVGVPRNRVRAELLPLLERRFNPAIVDVLADEAEIAREDWRWMSGVAQEAAGRVCRRLDESWRIDAAGVTALPLGLARLVMRAALSEAAAPSPVSFRHVEEALRLARCGGPPVDAPGHRMERVGGEVVLTRGRPSPVNFFRYPLSIPGEVAVHEASCVVSALTAPTAGAAGSPSPSSSTAVLQLDKCPGPLSVRNRRPGDRFRPPGVGGRKKLQDYFVDRKVVRNQRDRVPLVVDASDRIVWVAGHSIDEDFRVTDPAQAVLILRLTQV